MVPGLSALFIQSYSDQFQHGFDCPCYVLTKFSPFVFFSSFVLCSLESSVLQLDETSGKVRAVPEKRCVLILREIPKNTPEKVCMYVFHVRCMHAAVLARHIMGLWLRVGPPRYQQYNPVTSHPVSIVLYFVCYCRT